MPEVQNISADETAEARKLWQKYLSLTKELLKFIDRQDIDTFLELVPQRTGLIEKIEALPSKNYRKLDEFKKIAEEIKPLDKEIMYKARAWLNKSRRQNSMVRSYDIGSSLAERSSVAFNRKY
ncbi:MAG: flagellar protein FliT [Selenomonadaceae bacterium]|nr:flagellar protein FliT [Selenomonadaceae bacterium]